MKSLFTLACFVVLVGGYIWGGTDDAKLRCVGNHFGDHSMMASAACVALH